MLMLDKISTCPGNITFSVNTMSQLCSSSCLVVKSVWTKPDRSYLVVASRQMTYPKIPQNGWRCLWDCCAVVMVFRTSSPRRAPSPPVCCQSVAETKTQVSQHLAFMPVASLWLKQTQVSLHLVFMPVASLWLKQRHKCHCTLSSCQLPVCGWNKNTSVTAPCLHASCQSVAETKTQVSLHRVFMPVASLWLKQTQHLNF